MVMVLVFEEEVIRVTCAYAPQVRRSNCEKDQFHNEMACLGDPGQKILGLGDFNRHVEGRIEGFTDIHGGYGDGERNV